MLKRILIAVVALVAGLFALGYILPAEQTVGRGVTVKASPEAIYAQLVDLRKWEAWAPWSPSNFPAAQFTFDGPEVGVGARMAWQGTGTGGGTLRLTHADPPTGIGYEMWTDADRRKSTGTIQLVASGPETLVIWTWRIRVNDPIERWKELAVDETFGPQYEEGLVRLKQVAESEPQPASDAPPPESPVASPDEASESSREPTAAPEPGRDSASTPEAAPQAAPAAEATTTATADEPQQPIATPTAQ